VDKVLVLEVVEAGGGDADGGEVLLLVGLPLGTDDGGGIGEGSVAEGILLGKEVDGFDGVGHDGFAGGGDQGGEVGVGLVDFGVKKVLVLLDLGDGDEAGELIGEGFVALEEAGKIFVVFVGAFDDGDHFRLDLVELLLVRRPGGGIDGEFDVSLGEGRKGEVVIDGEGVDAAGG
jgi:hypothetical protein